MAKKKQRSVSPKLQAWIEAPRCHRLSHAPVQMARERGMNPRKVGQLDNQIKNPAWKLPLALFIEKIYLKQFGRECPELVRSPEEINRQRKGKKQRRREAASRQAEKTTAGDERLPDPLTAIVFGTSE